jgi:Cyclic nucleotide-binding domain.
MFERFKNLLPFEENQWKDYKDYFTKIEVPAKTMLVQEGEISKKVFFIEKGCIRVWFNNDGKDVTFQFFFERERVSSVESFNKNIPSIVSLETIEPCILWVIGKNDMDRIMKDGMAIAEVREKWMDALFERNLHYMKHCLSFIKDTPLQRYLNLIEKQPQVVQRVPQHYIASYLGITKVHLSRIKSKLLKGK